MLIHPLPKHALKLPRSSKPHVLLVYPTISSEIPIDISMKLPFISRFYDHQILSPFNSHRMYIYVCLGFQWFALELESDNLQSVANLKDADFDEYSMNFHDIPTWVQLVHHYLHIYPLVISHSLGKLPSYRWFTELKNGWIFPWLR